MCYVHVWPRDDDTEKQEQMQVCENNWLRRMVGVKRADRSRMVGLRVEVGVKRADRRLDGLRVEVGVKRADRSRLE